jgi:hypothetical protein
MRCRAQAPARSDFLFALPYSSSYEVAVDRFKLMLPGQGRQECHPVVKVVGPAAAQVSSIAPREQLGFSITSNGTLPSDEVVSFIVEHEIAIGISPGWPPSGDRFGFWDPCPCLLYCCQGDPNAVEMLSRSDGRMAPGSPGATSKEVMGNDYRSS